VSLKHLLDLDGLTAPGYDEAGWFDFVEHVAEALDVGAGSRVWDAGCGAGAFLYPLDANGYIVGGVDPSAALIAEARAAMPRGRFDVGRAHEFNPAEPWDVAVASHGTTGCRDLADVRALLARMAATATHAFALLNVDEDSRPGTGRAELLRLLAEIGVAAVQFETTAGSRLQVFARPQPKL
jgi:predicted TPR repeat methyltransferase